MTYRELTRSGEAELIQGPHPEKARLNAETLLLHLLGKDRAWLLANSASIPTPEENSRYLQLIARRRTGEPIQYITGEAAFFGLTFNVSPKVFIPRPETEHLVEEVIRLASLFADQKIRIADIGTGSGAITVALAHALPEAHITATDLSNQALEVACANAKQNHVTNRVTFVYGGLLDPLSGNLYHVIASNPPYIPASDQEMLSTEVREHEPHTALFAGSDGLNIYRRLIPAAREHLFPNGWLVLEIGYGQQPAIDRLLHASNYRQVRFVADYQGIPRVAVACKPA